MTERTCTEPDCDRKAEARGWCKKHYNHYRYPDRHKRVRDCQTCGTTYTTGRADGRFCCYPCRDAWRRSAEGDLGRFSASRRDRILTRLAVAARGTAGTAVFVEGPCADCGKRTVRTFNSTSRHCSTVCKQRGHSRQRRRWIAEATVEPVNALPIYKRDRWRCQICKRKVRTDVVWPHPRFPTLDHVVPVSQGGSHTAANLRLACFRCNTARGNRGGGEQLALLG